VKTRVLVVADYYLPGFRAGGPVRAISNTIARLTSSADFFVVTRDHDVGGAKYLDVEAGRWIDGGTARVLYASRLTPGLLRRCVEESGCDVIWLNSLFSRASIALLALRALGRVDVPMLLAPRGELSPGALAIKRIRKATALRLLRWSGCLRSVHWLASSKVERAVIARTLGRVPITCVPESVAPVPHGDERWPSKSGGQLNAVFASRVARTKNLLFLLETLATCNGDIGLDIIGPLEDRDYWARCRALIARLPSRVRVRYVGEVPHADLHSRLASYDLLILPTVGESFGHIVVEAWAAGCPVLVSDRTPWRQLAEGGVGWDVPLRHDAWAAALRAALDIGADDHLAMRRHAREHARSVWREGLAGDSLFLRLLDDAGRGIRRRRVSSSKTPESPVASANSRMPSPESRAPNAESRTATSESRVPNPESRVANPEFRAPSPGPRAPSPGPRAPSPGPRAPSPGPRAPSPECA
jgi:glycosyltransferase involved in cell wall biosynthesis